MRDPDFNYTKATLSELQTQAAKHDAYAMNALAWRLAHGEGVAVDGAESRRWYARSAALGNAEGLYNLGVCHVNGDLGKIDPVEACRLWRLAAAKNHYAALGNLGISYYYGNGVPQDYVQAREWFLRSANTDEPRAMGMMGQFYHLARGVPEDKIEALAWYLLAAEQSDETAVPRTNLMRELTPAQQASARTRAEVLRQSIKRTSYLD
jgi:TPR repeat protein